MKKITVMVTVLTVLCAGTLTAQNFNILKDINESKDSYPSNNTFGSDKESGFALLNGIAYFNANDGINGSELWRSDGTKAGTYMVKDILPGSGSGYPFWIIKSGNNIFFVADDGIHGLELWKSDGTDAGTVMVKDILPGKDASVPQTLVDVNGLVFFIASDGVNGYEVWRSDGTDAGTFMVKDITPGLNYQNPIYLTKVKNKLWFVINSNYNSNDGIYSTDGTEAGTVQIFSSTGCGQIMNVGNKVFFSNYDYTYGNELWVSDGVQTSLVKDIVPGANGSFPSDFANMNGILYFSGGANPYSPGTDDRELWRSDGTVTGTYQVANIYPDAYHSSSPQKLTVVKDKIFLVATNAQGTGLWKSDGTASGTVLLKIFAPPNLINLTAAKDKLYFSSLTNDNGQELWISDGTDAGTVMVKDIYPGIAGSDPSYLTTTGNNNNVLFAATNNLSGIELWVTDGTSAKTILIKDINKTTTSSSNPFGLTVVNNQAVFFASTSETGSELWKTNGTKAGTQLVKDIYPGSLESDPHSSDPFSQAGNSAIFMANTASTGTELWKTDGTPGGTQLLKDITPGTESSSLANDPFNLKAFQKAGDKTYFVAYNSPDPNNNNLWITNGTESGTYFVKSFPNADYLRDFTGLKDKMLFSAASYSNSSQLWVTDGTTAGTAMINGVIPKAASFRAYKDSIAYFNTADDNLWITDGTSAGTHVIKSNFTINNPDYNFYPHLSVSLNNNLVFSGEDYTLLNGGVELCVSNGTTAGTKLLKDINAGPYGSYPDELTSVNGILLFTADDGVHGRELWKSNGTSNGTVLVKDITPGLSSSNLRNLTNVNGKLLFIVIDSLYNQVLWESDGTKAGTHPVEDSNFPELQINAYSPWLVVGDKMLFYGSTTLTGNELGIGTVTTAASSLQFAGTLKEKDALLNWKTVNEKNIAKYNLQRSSNGIDFTTIGQLSANKDQAQSHYSYVDENISDIIVSTVYYRLQQISSKDEVSYSKTVALDLKNAISIDVRPNPVTNNFQLNLDLKRAQWLSVKVSDAAGNIVLAEQRNMAAGNNALNYCATNWAAGTYVLSATLSDGTRKEIKIVKQ